MKNKAKTKFINELYSYKQYLEGRLDTGAKYIDENNCYGDKYYNAYVKIIDELSHIQALINYYEG